MVPVKRPSALEVRPPSVLSLVVNSESVELKMSPLSLQTLLERAVVEEVEDCNFMFI